ncbi:hypothetical protein [Amycolatopsis aidingensis]|uniref:hypothetical protein n=1 Tax=Amycolatopsis aidingensis TaxID=2842453 RepID=UPI001C0BF89D|nr:hypothetical protein [Amycolatopsis aidingensis]
MSDDSDSAGDGRIVVAINPLCHTRPVPLYHGRLPGLIIGDGTDEVVLTIGPRLQDASVGKEFAIALASHALAFAGFCNRRLADRPFWPADDPESRLERDGHDFP